MGPYCQYCQKRCFTYFPEGTPAEAIKAYRPGVTITATCTRGQQAKMERTGWCYDKIVEAIEQQAKTQGVQA